MKLRMSATRLSLYNCSIILLLSSFFSASPWTSLVAAAKSKSDSTNKPPPFFLQDQADNLCLAGSEFKRCSIDTLFYVVGSPGTYQIHHYVASDEPESDPQCLAKKTCSDDPTDDAVEDLKLTKCSHCGAKDWNVLGEAETGFVLTVATDFCVYRGPKNTALTALCDNTDLKYTPLQLKFVSEKELAKMSTPAALVMTAAADGNLAAVRELVETHQLDINDVAADQSNYWNGGTPLIPAASHGNVDVIDYLLEKGANVNAADANGMTALMEACIHGRLPAVKRLVGAGAEIDAPSATQVTALWLAASSGHADLVQYLLDNDAAPASAVRADGVTALMAAANHTSTVQLLLQAGADASAKGKNGETALMNAAENGNLASLQLLTSAHPDSINAVSEQGYTALVIASANGKADCVAHLVQAGASLELAGTQGVTPLMYAVASDQADVAKLLLDAGANLESKHSNGGTALLEAATVGAVASIRLLLQHGAQVDVMDADGVTVLMAIASQGSTEGQTLVLDALKKVKTTAAELTDYINLLSYSGGSTVMFAAAGGHLENTKQLLELGADIKAIARATPEYLEKLAAMIADGTANNDEPHVDGVTALHVAAQGGHLDVVEFLLEKGVDVSWKDDEGRTPLWMAIKDDHAKVAIALVKGGADPNTTYIDDKGESHNLLFDAIMVENADFAKLLIASGADLYHKDAKSVSTLLQASHRGLADIVTALTTKHAATNGGSEPFLDLASEEGVTPLIAAASEGHTDVVKALIAAKANVDATDKDGTTALMAAAARGHLDASKELLAAGANINVQNADGHTALMFGYNGKNQLDILWDRYKQYLGEHGSDGADDGGTVAIVKESLDRHIALIELLLKKGADPTIKDKEGHTAKDFDYKPEVDASVLDKAARAAKARDESKNEL